MKYLGIDFGSRQIGIAISDDRGTMAFPRVEIPNNKLVNNFIIQMIQDERVDAVVVGDTRAFNGHENRVTEMADRFIADLTKAITLPVYTALEGGTSVEAARFAPKGHTHDDAAAAAIILQRFLDMHASSVK